jgi:uncharacterized protein (TIGR00255 family)
MTGYARHQATLKPGELEAEAKSVNSRYLEISIRLPKLLSSYEYSLREQVKQYITRGKLLIQVNLVRLNPEFSAVSLNEDILDAYFSLLQRMKDKLRLKGDIGIEHLLQFREIFDSNESSAVDEEVENELKHFVGELMQKHRKSRQIEGGNLMQDIQARLQVIKNGLARIKPLAQQNPQMEFDKQKKRLMNLLKGHELDENRLLQELAILADKVDVTEEIVRLESHIQLFEQTLQIKEPTGKKLNFILQEFHRELNTMGVKTTLLDISKEVVHMKEEVEKIREQIQNIE